MDIVAHNSLIKAAQDQSRYCNNIVDRVLKTGLYMDSEYNSFWDLLFLTKHYEESLEGLLQIISNTRGSLPWMARLCASVVDDAAPGRGLLAQSLFLAVEAGLIVNEQEASSLLDLLYGALSTTNECLVAYLDYVNASDGFDWREFQSLWISMHADAAALGMAGYYWRSSDSFYFARTISNDKSNDEKKVICTAFLDFLLHIQAHRCIGKQEWFWSIGIALGEASLVGDILIPGEAGLAAADAMKLAIDKLRGGGAILANDSFINMLSSENGKLFETHATSKKYRFYDRFKHHKKAP